MKLTPKIVAAIAHEEGLVLEAYKDSQSVWTWALGVTGSSGHQVHPRYVDKPSTIEKALEVSIWLLENRYMPTVRKAFEGCNLNEHQLAGALSFHWNTGAIARASWVKFWKAGLPDKARASYLSWNKPEAIVSRRKRDAALFFDGVWGDLSVPVYPVAKPSYAPHFRKGRRADLLPVIEQLMGGS